VKIQCQAAAVRR